MWDQPHYTFHTSVLADIQHMTNIELWVPGSLVYGLINGHRRVRLAKLCEKGTAGGITECEIYVPLHGAWLVTGYLASLGLEFNCSSINTEGIQPWDNTALSRANLEGEGRRLAEIAVKNGELRPNVLDIATPYQFRGVAWSVMRPWIFNVWSAGSGKTLGTLMSITAEQGPVVIVTPAKARHVWWSQTQEYTTIKPFRVRPSSEVKKSDQTLDEYLGECYHHGNRPFLIIGAEALSDYLAIAKKVQPRILVFDELHMHGSSKRWNAIQEADGSVSFERRKTAASGGKSSKVDRHNRAVAAMDLSRLPSVTTTIGLSATPLDDGRPRRLWSQLDLLSPGGFSHSYSKFALRYCNARPGQYGGLNDTGSSHIDELKARCSFLVHEVPYKESHEALPDTRVQVVYLSHTELNRAERWSDKQTFNQAIKGFSKSAKQNPLAREQMIEARLSEACSRKRKYVTSEAVEGLKGGGKVVVFVARRREAEIWANDIGRTVARGDEAQKNVPVFMIHGGVPESEKDAIIDQYRDSNGPCCLVATGQSVGTGVDGMQTTDLAIFAMLPWKPGDWQQWKGRFDRLGGRATLLKVPIAEGTYDGRVVEILVEKFGPIGDFLAADELKGLDQKLLGLEDKDPIVDSIISKLTVE
jgi:hypothetical protein